MMNPFEGWRITSPYGLRPDPHGRVKGLVFHAGIDLANYHKAPVSAFVGGIVQFATEARGTGFGGFGKVVAIRVDDDTLHCYCHLDSVSVKVGQQVKKGDVIGKQGSTGTDAQGRPTSTASHLHFEVRKKSSPNNGWNDDESKRCYEPTQYLIDYFAKEEKPVEQPKVTNPNEPDAWAKDTWDQAIKDGVTDGTRPKDNATRQEIIAMIYRAKGVK